MEEQFQISLRSDARTRATLNPDPRVCTQDCPQGTKEGRPQGTKKEDLPSCQEAPGTSDRLRGELGRGGQRPRGRPPPPRPASAYPLQR